MIKYFSENSRHSLFSIVIWVVVSSCASVPKGELRDIAKAPWTSKKVASGVEWKYHHFHDLFDGNQSVTVFEMNPGKAFAQINHVDSGFFKTSTSAAASGAVVAINGSFFDTKKGGSVVFFRKAHKELHPSGKAPRGYWEDAGISVDADGKLSIVKRPPDGWESFGWTSTVLASGPLLIYDGVMQQLADDAFNANRHPRTALGLTDKGTIIVVVVDGRSSEAYGMTMEEIAKVMEAFRCEVALNLDGGGSSTAWVQGQPFNGVVNYPSDNKQFDHEGERSVSNCVVFMPRR